MLSDRPESDTRTHPYSPVFGPYSYGSREGRLARTYSRTHPLGCTGTVRVLPTPRLGAGTEALNRSGSRTGDRHHLGTTNGALAA